VGPDLYALYGLPWDKKIVEYIHSLGAGVKLHICGNITPIMELLREAGPDILDIDWMVDFAKKVMDRLLYV
jgi:uroporphyrinogen-III decarboxylase